MFVAHSNGSHQAATAPVDIPLAHKVTHRGMKQILSTLQPLYNLYVAARQQSTKDGDPSFCTTDSALQINMLKELGEEDLTWLSCDLNLIYNHLKSRPTKECDIVLSHLSDLIDDVESAAASLEVMRILRIKGSKVTMLSSTSVEYCQDIIRRLRMQLFVYFEDFPWS